MIFTCVMTMPVSATGSPCSHQLMARLNPADPPTMLPCSMYGKTSSAQLRAPATPGIACASVRFEFGKLLVGVVVVVEREGHLLDVVGALHPGGRGADLLHGRQATGRSGSR